MVISTNVKEGFLEDYCRAHQTCFDCTNASGCSWCPQKKTCLLSTSLKSTDPHCNQNNTLSSSFLCKSEIQDKIPSDAVVSHDVLYDYALYRNQITDRIPPPNVFTTSDMEYSPETVMGNVNHLEKELKLNQANLPGIIATTVQNNIRPMVNGILSDNYYIQG